MRRGPEYTPQQIHTTFSRDRIGVVPPANTPRFGESPLERASRINSILDRARVKTQNPQEARPKEKGLFRQYASDVVDDLLLMANYVLPGSRKKAIALGTTAAMLVAACGDTTTETTLPTTTSITIETTIPTTTLPPTTTTEPTIPPSTTTSSTPETTTTTIPITEPTGNVYNGDFIAKLGLIEENNFGNFGYHTLSGRITDLDKIKAYDFQGTEVDVYVIKVVLGKYEDGTPYEVSFWFGRDEVDRFFTTQYYYLRNFKFSEKPGDIIPGVTEEMKLKLEELIKQNAQIGLFVPDILLPSYIQGCAPEQICAYLREGEEYVSNNIQIIDQLKNQSNLGVIKQNNSNNPIGWASAIIVFPENT